jgi:hypothetical protein
MKAPAALIAAQLHRNSEFLAATDYPELRHDPRPVRPHRRRRRS